MIIHTKRTRLPDCHEMHMSIECVISYTERALNTTTVKANYVFDGTECQMTGIKNCVVLQPVTVGGRTVACGMRPIGQN